MLKRTPLGNIEIHRIKIGGRTGIELLDDLTAAGIKLNTHANTLLTSDKFQTAQTAITQRDIKVAIVSVRDLGFDHGANTADVYQRAFARQLALCPISLAPHFRLQYQDQPEGASNQPRMPNSAPPGAITIACAPIDTDDDFPKGFYLRRIEGELWLRGYHADSTHVWHANDCFAFCLN
jgi:hypothetical protein